MSENDEPNVNFDGEKNASEENEPASIIRKSSCISKPPEKLQIKPKSKIYLIDNNNRNSSDPKTISEAMSKSDSEQWKLAIKSELESIEENDVLLAVRRPNDKVIIGTRWVFKIKRNSKNVPET